ncbi:MAG: MinD/ParA family protein [Chloroflexi bacterium]|nr:MinD/ParA family protein [Chloroflexota bacterium]
MPKVVAIHSFHGGAGKSMIAANLATLLTLQGKRVGLLDGNLHSPQLYAAFRLSPNEVVSSFSDYLRGRCSIKETILDVTSYAADDVGGKLFLLPNLPENPSFDGLDAKQLIDGFRELFHSLRLDNLILDIGAGLNPTTLPFLAITEALLIVSRLDQEDLQGTGVAIDIARKLDIPMVLLLINRVDESFDSSQVKSQVEKAYGCEVATVLPDVSDIAPTTTNLFALTYPSHPLTLKLKHLGERIAK